MDKTILAVISAIGVCWVSLAGTFNIYFVSHGGPADPFWAKVIQGMQDAAMLINSSGTDKVQVKYFAPPSYSLSEFVELLQAAVAARPDGLCVTITDYAAVDNILRYAITELNIPVIAINVADPRPREERIPYLTYVGNDQYLAGVRAAEYVLSKLTPRRAVVLIHQAGHLGLEARAKGFVDTMLAAGVPAEKLIVGMDPTQGIEIIRSYVKAHSDVDVIFTVGTLPSLWAIQFLREEGLTSKIVHAAHDVHAEILKAIKEGITLLTVSQRQYWQGYLSVMYMYWYLTKGFVSPTDVLTGPAIIDKNNINEVENNLLYW